MMNRTVLPKSMMALVSLLPLLAACTSSTEAELEAAIDQFSSEGPPSPSEFDTTLIVPDGTSSSDGHTTKNIARYTLPTDAYFTVETGSASVLESIVVRKCLQEQGVLDPIPAITYKHDIRPNPAYSPSGIRLFNAQYINQYGYDYPIMYDFITPYKEYHKAINEINSIAEIEVTKELPDGSIEGTWKIDPSKTEDPKYAALTRCYDKLQQDHPYIWNNNIDRTKTDDNATYEDTIKDNVHMAVQFYTGKNTEPVKEAAKRWKACMQPLGIPDLPDTPNDMPPESVSQGWYGGDEGNGEPNDVAHHQSVALALKDLECQQSSGYDRVYYDVQWAMLDQFVAENHEALLAIKQAFDVNEQQRLNYIHAHQHDA